MANRIDTAAPSIPALQRSTSREVSDLQRQIESLGPNNPVPTSATTVNQKSATFIQDSGSGAAYLHLLGANGKRYRLTLERVE